MKARAWLPASTGALVLVATTCLVACPPSLPATPCVADSECPSCYRCDVEQGFCHLTTTCAGGTCQGEACCTGCWSGAQCLPGDVESACGLGGSACAVCEAGAGCNAGRCGSAPASDLALGSALGCALRGDGTVWCMGSAAQYALGSGASGGATALPRQVLQADQDVALGPVRALAGRGSTFCAATQDGGAWCWGIGYYGQLGAGSTSNATRAVRVVDGAGEPLADVAELSVGGAHACARLGSAQVWCWGDNQYGQIGQGDVATGTYVHATPVLDATGAPLRGVAQVACGTWHTCVRGTSGDVRCTGANSSGQLGNGSNETAVTPGAALDHASAPLAGAVELASGSAHSCVRFMNGGVRCWGRGSYGELGDGHGVGTALAVEVEGLTGAVQLALGDNHSCALLDDGTARCWGYNVAGQLGDGTLETRLLPARAYTLGTAADGRFARLAAGSSHTCGLLQDGAIWCWGANGDGQLGMDALAQPTVLTPLAGPQLPATSCQPLAATAVSAGGNHACALTGGGDAWCWGDDASGQLGSGVSGGLSWRTQPVLRRVAGLEQARYEALAGSRADAFACAVAADRTAWCWGSAYLGRLGDGGIEQLQRVPVQVTTAAATPLSGVLHVSLGDAHACAAVEGGDGTAWCWGSDRYETLGNGPVDGQLARAAAVLRDATTTLTHVASVEVGTYHGCALLDSGQVWCWGLGESGRLGNPDTARQPYATQVVLDSGQPLDDATLLAVGAAHACVLRQDQGVWCWGANDSGQLGDGGNTSRHAPVQVLGAPGLVSALSLGGAHSCARTQEGQAWCWGANTFGQLGDGSAVSSSVPVRVQQAAGQALQAVVALSAGLAFTCAVDGAGATLCWGANSDGQLGQPRSTPLAMLPLVVAVGCR